MIYIIGLLFLLFSFVDVNATITPRCVLFYYHDNVLPDDIFYTYDWIFLDQDYSHIKEIKEKFYMKNRAKLIGYISVGEIQKHRKYFNDLKKFAIGRNITWDSFIADLRSKEYRDFLVNIVAKDIVNKGFDGFFLDTLDSYQLAVSQKEWKDFQEAEIELIKKLRELFPDKLIVLNRGFEIIDQVRTKVDGVAVESLFWGLDKNKKYRAVSEDERKYLLGQIEKIKFYGIPVIAIDYVEPDERQKSISVVKKISALGVIPYVSDAELSKVGYCECEIIPRKVILLYDSNSTPIRQLADVHRLIQMPLEYLGFVPEVYDINSELPEVYPNLGYAGVISMNIDSQNEKLEKWLLQAKKYGLKLFFINAFPFARNSQAFNDLGISLYENKDKKILSFRILRKISGDGFEAPLVISDADSLIRTSEAEDMIELENSAGQIHIPFAITNWGGYAVNNTLINNENELWVYNPFEIFARVFRNDLFPIPDTTTENGRRILTAHIDGDGFTEISEFNPLKTTGEIIRDEIIKVFTIPHTVSIIEGKVAPWGLYPEKSKKFELIAKSIFELPNVEMASHSFSHPFAWPTNNMTAEFRTYELKYGHNLPIKNYKINFEREIIGSINYIQSLLKDTKKTVKVFLWTGDCSPDEEQIKLTYKARVFNVNGGGTTITQQEPFLFRVSAMGLNYGNYFQVYAPITNENIFTNLWKGPFWGYTNVIQSFELTEKPKRLKPISIYYHFYSGKKLASLNALKKVYRYALSQSPNPMFLSEYAEKVLDFRQTAIIKIPEGFIVKNAGYLRTLRMPIKLGFPDIRKSKGVVGFSIGVDEIYVHLDGSGDYVIKLSQKKPDTFYLVSSNGQIESFTKQQNFYSIKLKSYVPLELNYEKGNCEVLLKKEGKYGAEIKSVCPD